VSCDTCWINVGPPLDGSGAAELEGGGGARCLVGAGDAQARPDSRVRAKRRRKRRKYGFPVGFFGGVLTADLDRMAHRACIVGLSTRGIGDQIPRRTPSAALK
jgi:hypothetical protein